MSGLVKGVKKVFSAIGNAVKKVLKSPIFKALLIGAAVIFTGGAAVGAFSALAGGASFGAAMSAGLAAGIAPFSAALGALTGAASSVGSALGIGGTVAAEGAAAGAAGAFEAGFVGTGAISGAAGVGEAVATGAALSEGAAGLAASGGTDAMAAYAAEAAAPGAASWAGAAEPFSLANVGGGYTPFEAGFQGSSYAPVDAGAQAAQGASQTAFQPELLQTAQPAPYQAPPMEMVSNTGVAPTMQTAPGNGYATGGSYVPVEEGFTGTRAISGAQGAGAPSNGFMSSLWDFVKPDTAASRLLWGQTLQGAANGIMQGRQAQEERDYRAARSAVPRNVPRYEAIPGHAAWALNGKA